LKRKWLREAAWQAKGTGGENRRRYQSACPTFLSQPYGSTTTQEEDALTGGSKWP